MWCIVRPPRRQRRTATLEVARPPSAIAIVCPGASGPERWSSVTWIRQPPGGPDPAPGGGDVAAEADQHPAARSLPHRPGAAVGGPRFGGGAEVEHDPAGNPHGGARRVKLDGAVAAEPPGDQRGRHLRGRLTRTLAQQRKVAVVARQHQRGANRWIDVTAGYLGGTQGYLQRLEQQRRDPHRAPPGVLVDPGQVGVGAETAAGTVDRVELARENRAGAG